MRCPISLFLSQVSGSVNIQQKTTSHVLPGQVDPISPATSYVTRKKSFSKACLTFVKLKWSYSRKYTYLHISLKVQLFQLVERRAFIASESPSTNEKTRMSRPSSNVSSTYSCIILSHTLSSCLHIPPLSHSKWTRILFDRTYHHASSPFLGDASTFCGEMQTRRKWAKGSSRILPTSFFSFLVGFRGLPVA